MRSPTVLSIECIKGSSKADEWTVDMLQTGDIVEEIRIGSGSALSHKAPFKGGKSGVQKILHTSYRNKETSILVRVRRASDEFAQLQACIVPNETGGKKQYMLRSIADPNYTVGFSDRSESECFELQVSRNSRIVSELSRTRLQDGYVWYPWQRRMQEASGVPILFINIQTEFLLTKISGETASATVNAGSLSDLANLGNATLYGFEDYHGVDIGVVRAVRLWYTPLAREIAVEIKLEEDDTKLGFAISRTEEGFIYISSVIDVEDLPSTRSGLCTLYKESMSASRLLVVSRLSNQKVLPWTVSSTGAVRCFDTVSLSQKLSLHRHAKVPILMHVFSWDPSLVSRSFGSVRLRVPSTSVLPLTSEVGLAHHPNSNQILPLPPDEPSESVVTREQQQQPDRRLQRDTAGETSFRFHDFSLPNNWV
ncbi:hypothetical protein V6Z12_A07G145200 [Gossypium hirsutum]